MYTDVDAESLILSCSAGWLKLQIPAAPGNRTNRYQNQRREETTHQQAVHSTDASQIDIQGLARFSVKFQGGNDTNMDVDYSRHYRPLTIKLTINQSITQD